MASRSLGTLTIDLLLRTAGMEAGASKAERELARLQTRAVAVGTAMGKFIADAAQGVARGLYNMTLGVAKSVEQMDLLSRQIGVSTEDLTRLQYAANQMANVSDQQFGMAMRRMTRRIAEAAEGAGPAANAIRAIGLEARDLARMKPDEQFRKLADALSNTEHQGSRLRATMAIFDTEGMPLVNMLSQGADAIREFENEADQLGVTIGEDLVNRSRAFQTELTKLSSVKQGLQQRIASELLPTLTNLVSRFTESEGAAKRLDWAARVASTGVKLLSSVATVVIGVFKTLGEALGGIAAAVVSLVQGRFSEAWSIAKDVGSDIVGNVRGTMKAVSDIWDETEITATPQADAAENDSALAFRAVKSGGKRIVDEAERIWKQVEQAIGRISRDIQTFFMTEDEKVLFDLRIQGADPDQLARAQELLRIRRDLIDTRQREEDEARRRERASSVLEDINLEIDALGKSSQWIATRNALLRAGVDAESDFGRAIVESMDNLYKQGEAIDRQIELMDTFRSESSRALSDVVRGAKSLKDAFLDMLTAITDRITQMISDRLIEQLFGQMGTTQSGSSGGWISSLFGGLFGGRRANGGMAQPNKIYEVNERGIEMATVRGRDYLLTGGSPVEITPNHRIGMGRSVSVVQQFINPVLADRRSDSQRAAEAARRQREALRNA